MLVEVGKFTFLADLVILKMEEDNKVPLILGRPFLHTADAVIRVKQKQLNLGVGTERMIFHNNSAMKHSYSNDDTRFSIEVIDEILEEDFDALLDEATFQRCMLAIFHDMIKESVERYKDAHLVLNWEKCHFMVKEGIVLGYKVSEAGFKVDKAKIKVISNLPPLTNIKVIRVKQKQLNLRVGTKRMIFHIDFVMKHSYSNDDTHFSIDEILEEDFDALLDEGSEILHSIEGTILEE
nr:reverse transcriptase domain-containing protein [Tanacetum cinerariifolium]